MKLITQRVEDSD